MFYYVMPSDDIRHNLATEEYLMYNREFDEPLVLFYYEKPSIIVGRNQNTQEEVNQKFIDDHNIVVTRRRSGGGAVYHDLGNLCFSFVLDTKNAEFGDFKTFVSPIIKALHEMGATTAEVSGRNDMIVDGKKFSGSAMFKHGSKIYAHGTLMLDVDLDVVTKALNVPADKIASKGIKSVRSRVTNLKPYLDEKYQDLDVIGFRDALLKHLFAVEDLADIKDKEVKISTAEEAKIEEIYETVYNNWDWVYGTSPAFTVQKRQHFAAGTIDARLDVKDGIIDKVTFYGDFFGTSDVSELEAKFVGIKYNREELEKVLASVELGNYFLGIDHAQILDLLA
ncbi:lipoate--protein ligase [Periweissella fabalis]|uniref:lipoate--protein ligase n=1 Tax=Periweissella fabalis TaxID=1070421 RepID=A0A7X6N377_9LACO|nr:lipoate--protein ligase [Periweissella fabalis]MCM0598632.1 lipoate--protein ligase [Periweissella fabalis]NKZ24285.1 lipoate--protein ligase [Periweissella fabalis]